MYYVAQCFIRDWLVEIKFLIGSIRTLICGKIHLLKQYTSYY